MQHPGTSLQWGGSEREREYCSPIPLAAPASDATLLRWQWWRAPVLTRAVDGTPTLPHSLSSAAAAQLCFLSFFFLRVFSRPVLAARPITYYHYRHHTHTHSPSLSPVACRRSCPVATTTTTTSSFTQFLVYSSVPNAVQKKYGADVKPRYTAVSLSLSFRVCLCCCVVLHLSLTFECTVCLPVDISRCTDDHRFQLLQQLS